MSFELMAHQKDGISFLTEGRAGLLAFEQGLGKTLVSIDSFRRVWLSGEAKRLLVICPNSLKRNWMAELGKFAPELSVVIAEGSSKTRRNTFATTNADVVVTSYETARSEVTAILALVQKQPTALVLDESHAAKNWRSLTSTAARHIAPHCVFRWLLSGTPVTNSPADLHTQIEILAPGQHLLGSQEAFMATIERDPDAGFAKQVFDRLILRRTKEDCLDLPDKTFVDIRVDLPAWQRKLYDDMRTQMVCDIQAMTGEQYRAYASTALAQLTRLSQIASNPGLLFPELESTPGKFEALEGIVADILSVPSRKVIIWSNYVRTIDSLIERFREYGVVAIYGGTPNSERQGIAHRFQTDDCTRVLIANPAAAGTGFTLTAATYTIYETLSWRYDHYAQSQDRNHRIGQDKPVTYIRLLAANTIEEAIITALERKTSMARSLLGDEGGEPGISQLSKEEMCELLTTNRLPERQSTPA
ncbi:DEAD/DEAH box helicase [Microvirga rosea]|uniref:DEAD/DEAH box helicase n=1 Tax=Microvirga rosea TaxID=2715425 RepID=UPI001D0ABC48|nr:DEAD/DEAH box helicase [Microvirga rosea]MCB8821917.1 DEAD/DEAH box helicase [Microvirga rosea]